MNLALVKLHINNSLSKLGTTKDAKSSPPEGASSDNRFPIAWEYFVADLLCSLATKRKDVAKKAAVEAGILVKPDPGETVTIYNSGGLQLIAKTKQASITLDRAALSAELIKELGADKTQRILKKAEKHNTAATTYDFVSSE